MNKEFMDRAAGAFMVIRVTVKRWEGIKQSRKVAQAAADAEGAEVNALGGHIKMLGVHHAELKRVKAANAKINTYLYEKALPSDIDGEYMFHVDQVPKVITDLNKLKAEAEAVLADFLVDYENFVAAAKAHLKTYGKGVDYPSVDEVRERFAITISAPDFVPMADVARFKHLPVAQAAQWAEEAEAKVARKIENAREYILDSTRKFMADAERAIAEDKFRTTDKKAREVEHLSTELSNLVKCWDNDPRLMELVDIIDIHILPAIKGKTLKGSSVRQAGVRRAAKTIVKGIDDHKKNQANLKKHAAKSDMSGKAKPKGTPVGGGMIADLI